jgi:O-antigen/teichoic acid export membrane protein
MASTDKFSTKDLTETADERVTCLQGRMNEVNKERASRNRAWLLGAGTSVVNRGLNLLVTFVSSCLLLPYLGAESYGLWATLISIGNLVAMGNLGLGLAITTKLPLCENDEESKTFATSGFILSGIFSVGVGVVALFSCTYFNLAGNIVKATDKQSVLHNPAILWAISGGCLAIFLNTGSSVLAGHQKTHLDNALKIPSSLALAIATWLLVAFKCSTQNVFAITLFLTTTTALLPLCWSIYSGKICFKKKYIHFSPALKLAALGVSFFLLQSCVAIIQQSGVILIANYDSLESAGEYDIAWKLSTIPGSVSLIAFSALWPVFGSAIKAKDLEWIKTTLARAYKFSFLVWAPYAIFTYMFGDKILAWLFGQTAGPPRSFFLAIAITVLFRMVNVPLAYFLNAAACTKYTFIGVFLQVVIFFLVVRVAITPLGPIAIPLAESLSYALTLLPISLYAVKRKLSDLESTGTVS